MNKKYNIKYHSFLKKPSAMCFTISVGLLFLFVAPFRPNLENVIIILIHICWKFFYTKVFLSMRRKCSNEHSISLLRRVCNIFSTSMLLIYWKEWYILNWHMFKLKGVLLKIIISSDLYANKKIYDLVSPWHLHIQFK